MSLKGKIALVTGASRGIGRGIALQLGTAGATVCITGREASKKPADLASTPALEKTASEITERGGKGVAIFCDHGDPEDVKRLFAKIETEHGGLDILVNNAYSGIKPIVDNLGKKFWETDPLFWDEINNVGLRNHYICSVYAARLMVPKKSGLIVNISSWGGLGYLLNMPYGVGKEACDRMAADGAMELRPHNVAFVSLWPGFVQTELFTTMKDSSLKAAKDAIEAGETPEYPGKCVVHLAKDPKIMEKSGKVLITGDLGAYYGFVDINGRKPKSYRSLKSLFELCNYNSSWVPDWIKVPGWMLNMGGNKL